MRKEHSIYTGLIYLIKRNKGERNTSLPTSAEMGHSVVKLVLKCIVPLSALVPKCDIPFWHSCQNGTSHYGSDAKMARSNFSTNVQMGHPILALVPKWDIPFWNWCLTLTLTASTAMEQRRNMMYSFLLYSYIPLFIKSLYIVYS
jgi:hypothetical protein